MAVGGAADAGSSARGGSMGSSSESDKAQSYSKADRQAKTNGKNAENKPDQRTATVQNGREATVEEQGQSLRDFDKVQGRPSLGDWQLGENVPLKAKNDAGSQVRSNADMQARVEAYQKDFDRTLNEKIETIDKELEQVDQRLEKANGHGKRNLTQRKEKLTEQRQNLQNLANSPDGERQAKFEAYQREFDQAVNDQIAGLDKKIADIDRRLDQMDGNTPMGARVRSGLLSQKKDLEQKRDDLQKIADTPDAALEALKAKQAQQDGGWTASDIGHLALDVIGMAPVVGEWADVLNAVWYFAEGKPVEGAMSMTSAIPGIGNVSTMSKWLTRAAPDLGRGGGKFADDGVGATKRTDATNSKTADGAAVPTSGRQQLIDEIVNNGGKINAGDVIDIRKLPNGKIVWLETGSNTAGQQHILRHAGDFEKRGISESQIPDALFKALESENVIGYQGKGKGRPIYEFDFNGQIQRIAITVGDNGFIVGANPAK